jgi:hypothetical protein
VAQALPRPERLSLVASKKDSGVNVLVTTRTVTRPSCSAALWDQAFTMAMLLVDLNAKQYNSDEGVLSFHFQSIFEQVLCFAHDSLLYTAQSQQQQSYYPTCYLHVIPGASELRSMHAHQFMILR